MRLILATSNRGKLDELRSLLPTGTELLSLNDLALRSPEETGATFAENAIIKARAALVAGDAALADDSGLEVDALGGSPGIYSARFAGPEASDKDNNDKLLADLLGIPAERRTARFVSAVAFVAAGGTTFTALGTVTGRIVTTPRGSGGFGYDPLFEIDDPEAAGFRNLTIAELEPAQKNAISHRARAYRSLINQLRSAGVSVE